MSTEYRIVEAAQLMADDRFFLGGVEHRICTAKPVKNHERILVTAERLDLPPREGIASIIVAADMPFAIHNIREE